MSMSVICIIPARGGSKGLPRKNILPVAGHPLIAYPIAAARESGVCDSILVTTDDEEIAEVARKYGADVPFLRPDKLSQDLSTTEETLQHALLSYEAYTGRKFDIGVFLTSTDLFRRPEWVARAVSLLRGDSELESAFTANPTHKNFWHKSTTGHWERIQPWMEQYSSRQVRQKIYREDTGLTCASRAELWRQGRRIGNRVEILPNDHMESSLDIHTAFDLFLVEQAITYLRTHYPERAPVT